MLRTLRLPYLEEYYETLTPEMRSLDWRQEATHYSLFCCSSSSSSSYIFLYLLISSYFVLVTRVVLIHIHLGAAFGTLVLKLQKEALTVAGSLATAQRSEERMLPSVALGGTLQPREYTPWSSLSIRAISSDLIPSDGLFGKSMNIKHSP